MKRYRESRIYRLYNSNCTMKEKRIYERVCLMNFLSRSREKDDESIRLVTKVSMIVSALRRIEIVYIYTSILHFLFRLTNAIRVPTFNLVFTSL